MFALVYLALIAAGLLAGQWVEGTFADDLLPQNEARIQRMVAAATVIFVIASALPFVPGAEIGFALLMVLGSEVALLVYGAMVSALTLAFCVGRLVPLGWIARIFGYLGFRRAAGLVTRMAGLSAEESLALLLSQAPQRFVPVLIRHRYLALLLVLNLPGNTVLGGGGGIALMAGVSRLFSPMRYFATVAVAVAPVPLLAVWLGY